MQLDFSNVLRSHPQPGVTTRRQDFMHLTVVLYEFDPHSTFPLHYHSEEQLVLVLSGSCDFTIGDRTVTLDAGDSVVAAPQEAHGCHSGPSGCRFLNILSPKRTGDSQITLVTV